jgi:hypothetical protein
LYHDGATLAELRDYMNITMGRDIDRTSISPQLTRLREDGILVQLDDGKWCLKSRSFIVNVDDEPHAPNEREILVDDDPKGPSGPATFKRRKVG